MPEGDALARARASGAPALVRELFIDRLSPAELAVLRDALARRPARTPR
jgi:hypothetical protein